MKSTPSSPHSIILFTAFCHPHPTHTTVIFAIGDIEFEILTSCGQVVLLVAGTFHESILLSLSSFLAPFFFTGITG